MSFLNLDVGSDTQKCCKEVQDKDYPSVWQAILLRWLSNVSEGLLYAFLT
jgi:hypothetical protein